MKSETEILAHGGQSAKANEALRPGDAQLAADLADTKLLHELSLELAQQDDSRALYERIVDAAVAIMRSDFASMQRLYPERGSGGELRLLAFRGFNPEAAKFWEWVRADSESTCGMALRTGKRSIAPNVEECAFMAGTQDLATYLQTGIHAVQTTPLVSRGGKLVGMISTHWSRPHEPSERDWRLFDLLARQAADLIERASALQELKQASRRKDEFLATLSHELRNPLAPIRTAIELLDDPDRRMRDHARAILARQVAHMIRLVDDLLDLSRINQGSIELQKRPLELGEVLATAVETSRPHITAGGHDLDTALPAAPIMVEGDPVRLAQVVANLLNNAARYTQRGGHIRLDACEEAGSAVVSVSDNGSGISPQALPYVFESFERAGGELRRAEGGLGIGLSLSRRLVELHGGSIQARSEGLGRGALFTVRLPLLAAQGAGASGQPPAFGPQARRRDVLVVDDNVDAAMTLGLLLQQLGHDVRLAHDGPAALEAAHRSPPEIVLLDIGLPNIDGYGVAERLRRDRLFDHTRIVAITGYGQEEDRERSRNAGFDEHLLKPIAPDALNALMRR